MTRLPLLAALLLATSATAAPVPKAKPETFKAPDAKTIAAFRELGATYGTMHKGDAGRLYFFSLKKDDPRPDTRGELPAFSFKKWPEEIPPEIDVPFGVELDMKAGEIPLDLGKSMAKWKNLRAVSLDLLESVSDTNVERVAQFGALPAEVPVDLRLGIGGLGIGTGEITDDGFTQLKDMRCLTALTLGPTDKLTDRALTHLAKLDRLTSFESSGTRLTVAGIKQLRHLKHLSLQQATDDETITDSQVTRGFRPGRAWVSCSASWTNPRRSSS